MKLYASIYSKIIQCDNYILSGVKDFMKHTPYPKDLNGSISKIENSSLFISNDNLSNNDDVFESRTSTPSSDDSVILNGDTLATRTSIPSSDDSVILNRDKLATRTSTPSSDDSVILNRDRSKTEGQSLSDDCPNEQVNHQETKTLTEQNDAKNNWSRRISDFQRRHM